MVWPFIEIVVTWPRLTWSNCFRQSEKLMSSAQWLIYRNCLVISGRKFGEAKACESVSPVARVDDRFLFRQSASKFFWFGHFWTLWISAFRIFQSRTGETGDLVLALQDRAAAPGRAAAKLPCLDMRCQRANGAAMWPTMRYPGSFAWEWKCFYSLQLRDNCPVWWCYIPFKSQSGVCFCSSLWSMTHEFVTFSQSPELKHFQFHMLLGVVAVPILTVASLHQLGERVSRCRVETSYLRIPAHACQCQWWMLVDSTISGVKLGGMQSQQGFKRRKHENVGCLMRHATNPLTVSLKSALWPESECFSTAVLIRGTITSITTRLARLRLGFFWGLTAKPGAAALGFENSRALRVANDLTILIIILTNVNANQLSKHQTIYA